MRANANRPTGAAAALVLAGALVTGCTDAELNGDPALETAPTTSPPSSPAVTADPSPTDSPTSSSASDEDNWATCESSRASLQVSYPADWTARDYPDGGCAYFDPEPFEVQRQTEAPAVAVRLDVEPVAYDRVLSSYTDGEVLSQEETEVAGYRAVRVEDRDTDGPLGAKGQRLTYVAELGEEQTLILSTNEADASDLERAKDVLDEMAERLERVG